MTTTLSRENKTNSLATVFLNICCCLMLTCCTESRALATDTEEKPRFTVLVLAENGGHHVEYSKAARVWLNKLAADSSFTIIYLDNPRPINDSLLRAVQLFIQLDYPPYGWPPAAASAFERYITEGWGGWIGFHHASLIGEFDGYPVWEWFRSFMGDIRFTNYIPGFVKAKVVVEDSSHPCMKGLPAAFVIDKDEFYTYDRSPREKVRVLASVDERSYEPASTIKMGDHPVIWTNEKVKARNVYIFMGHSPDLFANKAYTSLFRKSLFWAVEKNNKQEKN